MASPRLFGITASDADVVAVLRRGPSGWCQLGRWDLTGPGYQPGAWLRGSLYPQRCDLSPDGRWFCAFVLRSRRSTWAAGGTYVSVSRLPWLTALAVWSTDGTWSRGASLVADRGRWEVGEPEVGDAGPLHARLGMAVNPAITFAVERRRGWVETSDTPPQDPDDFWDERRAARVRMEKTQPGGGLRLVVSGRYAAFRSGRSGSLRYELDPGDGPHPLPGVQWADWASDGRLLVATTTGALEVRHASDTRVVQWTTDLSVLTPDPQPAPAAATRW